MNGDTNEMKAVVIDGFGGPEVLAVRNVPVPDVTPDQILIKVEHDMAQWAGCTFFKAGNSCNRILHQFLSYLPSRNLFRNFHMT